MYNHSESLHNYTVDTAQRWGQNLHTSFPSAVTLHKMLQFFSSCTASARVLYASTHCFQQCTCAVYKQVNIDLSHSSTFLVPLSCDYIDDCIVTVRYTDNRWCFSTDNIITTSMGMSLRVLVHTDEMSDCFSHRREKIHPSTCNLV